MTVTQLHPPTRTKTEAVSDLLHTLVGAYVNHSFLPQTVQDVAELAGITFPAEQVEELVACADRLAYPESVVDSKLQDLGGIPRHFNRAEAVQSVVDAADDEWRGYVQTAVASLTTDVLAVTTASTVLARTLHNIETGE